MWKTLSFIYKLFSLILCSALKEPNRQKPNRYKIENGKYTKSTNENIIKFRDYLNEKGIVATVRRELGSDIDAACGQLRKKEVEKCESTQKQI